MDGGQSILKQMAVSPDGKPAEAPDSPSRMFRLSWTRAAEQLAGLHLSVLDVVEETLNLDNMLKRLSDDDMFLSLNAGADLVGIASLDLQLRAALVEVQTAGTMSAKTAEIRRVTAVDAALCRPVLSGFIEDLNSNSIGTDLAGWANNIIASQRIEDTRAASLAMNAGKYRLAIITAKLGDGDRVGRLAIALPIIAMASDPEVEILDDQHQWNLDFRNAVKSAPTRLQAVLHRTQLTLRDVEAFQVGQILPLNGCDIGRVELVGLNDKVVARGRLGQVGGMCAVRLQPPSPLDMQDMSPAPASQTLVEAQGGAPKPEQPTTDQ